MSTLMPASASGSKIAPRDAWPVGDGDERDLGDIAVVGQAADLVALLHERILPDERSGRVLERAEDLDDDVVDPAELHRADLHDLGALVGELEHLLVADDGRAGGRSATRRGSAVKMPRTSVKIWQRSARRAAARATAVVSEPPRPSVVISFCPTAASLWPWNPATMTTLPASISVADPARFDVRDAGPAVAAVRA